MNRHAKILALASFTLAVAASWLFVGQWLFIGCEPAVSDEATVTVEGRLLNADGTAASDVYVRLRKTDFATLEADWVVGSIVNQDDNPFMEARTDSQGYFFFEFPGDEANAKNQMWAAYFIAYAVHPDDPDNQLAVSSETFTFSNQNLNKVLPDMRFWDIEEGGITVDQEFVKVTFPESQLPPTGGTYIVHFEGTEWTAEVKGTTYQLPLTALEPCTAPVVDDAAECEPKTRHRVQIISLADDLRYRTAWHEFDAQNPQGIGIWYRNPEDNTSGRTCTGKVLLDLNDGKFSGENAIQTLGGGLAAEDLRCLVFDLQKSYSLDQMLIHNGNVLKHDESRIELFVSADEDPDTAEWESLYIWEGKDQRFWNLNLEIPGDGVETRLVKLEFTDAGDDTYWIKLGEISFYGTILDAVE